MKAAGLLAKTEALLYGKIVLLSVDSTYMGTPVGLIVVMALFLAFSVTLKTQSVHLDGRVISAW